MNLIQRFQFAMTQARLAIEYMKRGVPQEVESFRVGRPLSIPTDMADLTDAYRMVPAAFAGVRAIANHAAAVPQVVYRRRKGSDQVVTDHPLAEMLNPTSGKFNDWCTAYSGKQATFAFMGCVGTGYWLKDAEFRSRPTEFRVLRPDWIQPVPGKDRPVLYYLWGPPGSQEKQRIAAEDIVPFRYWNPLSDIFGQSPLLASRKNLVLQLYMMAFNEDFFANGAVLGGVVGFKQAQGRDFMKQQKEVFNDEHRGLGNQFKWRFVSGVEQIVELGKNFKDLQFNEGLTATERAVLRSLGVPPVICGYAEEQSYATAHEQKAEFYEGTIQPLCQLADGEVNLHVAPLFGRDLYVRSDFSNVEALLPKMEVASNAAGSAFNNGVITVGEYRQWIKSRRVPDLQTTERDKLYQNEIEQARGEDPSSAPDGGSDPAPAASYRSPVEQLIDQVNRDIRTRLEAERRETAKKKIAQIVARLEVHLPRFLRVILSVFRDQEDALMENRDRLTFADLGPVDAVLAGVRNGATKKVQGAFSEIVKSVGQEEIAGFGAGLKFNSTSELALEFIERWGAEQVVLIDQTTADTVRRAIKDALLEAQLAGDNIVETADRIMQAGIRNGMEIRRSRATNIAQTETNAALSFADLEAWRQSGVVETKVWNDEDDEDVRESHRIGGTEKNLDEPFNVGGHLMQYPADPAGPVEERAECRCFLTAGKLKLSYRVNAIRSRIAAMVDPPDEESARSNGSGVARC